MLKILPVIFLIPLILFAGMKCPYCGAENPDDAKFCWKCGKPLKGKKQESIQKKEQTSKREQHFIKCPYCGAENPENARFCWKCGKPLRQEKKKETRKTSPELTEQRETTGVNEALLDSILLELREIKKHQKKMDKLLDCKDKEIERLERELNSKPYEYLNLGCLLGSLVTMLLFALSSS